MDHELVAGRSCGSCNVCCVALTIDDPALQKPQGYRCRNTTPDHGCAIYDDRPQTCSSFFCGWRKLRWVRETLRPDLSQVLVRLNVKVSATGTQTTGVIFTLLSGAALKAEGLAETVAAAVAANIPVYVHIPGPPGYTASQVQVNEVLANAVTTRDKPGLLSLLRQIRQQGLAGKHVPIRLSGGTKPAPG